MLKELDLVHEKAAQLAQLSAQLRQENLSLRNRLLQTQRENNLLQQRLTAATGHVEELLRKVPRTSDAAADSSPQSLI